MKKLIIVLISLMLLSSCSVSYYTYYEMNSPEAATDASRIDGAWSKNRKTPTRCIGVYQKDGKTVYLMETEVKEKVKEEIDYD